MGIYHYGHDGSALTGVLVIIIVIAFGLSAGASALVRRINRKDTDAT